MSTEIDELAPNEVPLELLSEELEDLDLGDDEEDDGFAGTDTFVNRGLVVLDMDVHEAALARIRWLWDEFDGKVSVSFSGGKDSTVVLELAAIVARERGQKLRVQFLDQEAEWQSTRDYVRFLKDTREDLEVEWYQIPFKMFNASSHATEDKWGFMWPEGAPDDFYMRPPEVDSIRVNDFGTDRFKEVLGAINKRVGGVHLTGMRAEESPTRRLGMTTAPTYKYATWGAGDPDVPKDKPGAFWMMHPIYDWSYRDVWQAIESYGWKYNRLYDEMFRYGVPHMQMRVSALIHSGAVRAVAQVQEIEPETWEALVRRFGGVNAAAHTGVNDILERYRKNKPNVFDTYVEYFNYLVDNIIDEEYQEGFRSQFRRAQKMLPWMHPERIAQKMLAAVLKNDRSDYTFSKWTTGSVRWGKQVRRQTGKWPVSVPLED
ncbi:phosphoadenosine phosphosulfate reductase [Microbacterium phage Hendrix]|uniref:Adenylyltransferase n=1 Tax=Microbacterium phage Hendrix TaxID=2182341 RepID=A0A2U8UUD6_9CAUD|nr:phosphoadenosine phosphosulfate reductase [Microbacterium phage Hendrix]AWN07825.1 adenylyltransferase [Microbacterium phage Hendrix]